jgi:hypothetical protein
MLIALHGPPAGRAAAVVFGARQFAEPPVWRRGTRADTPHTTS